MKASHTGAASESASESTQLESSEPAETSGPPAEPAAQTSSPAEDAAVGDAAADTLPTGTEVDAKRKNKKKRKKRQQESDNLVAASQPQADDQPQIPGKSNKKKHKSGKVWPSSNVPGSVLTLDDIPTSRHAEVLTSC